MLTWRPTLDPDVWWHLALGDVILDGGAIPTIEPWSWWSAGQPILAHSWAWDGLIALAYRAGGSVAVSLVGAAASAAVVGLLWWLLRMTAPGLRAVVRGLLMVLATATALVVWSPRAQLVDLVAILAVIVVLERHARGAPSGELGAIPAIAVAWANLHGSAAPAGLVATLIVGGAGIVVGERLARWPARRKTPLIVAGVGAVAALLVNPAGAGLLAYPLDARVASAFVRDIAEWAPPDLAAPGLLGFTLVLVASVAALIWPTRRAGDPIVVLGAAAWAVLALTSARFVLIAGPLLVVAVGPVLLAARPRAARSERPPSAGTVMAIRAGGAIAIVAIVVAATTLIAPATQDRLIAATFPVDATARLAASDCHGRLLNAYDWGGYVLRHTDRQVGAYGNSPGEIVSMQASLEALRVDPQPILDQLGVGTLLLKPRSPLAVWTRAAGDWRAVLDDGRALIAVRTGDPCQIR